MSSAKLRPRPLLPIYIDCLQNASAASPPLRFPAQGAWASANDSLRRDEIVVLEVLTDYLDRTWWSALRTRLEARFRQETIVIRAFPVETL
jgi:hypothetical protein